MEPQELATLVTSDFEKLKSRIIESKAKIISSDDYKDIDVEQHEVVTDMVSRPDKAVTTEQGPKTVKVARIPQSYQKLIVNRAVAFLVGNPINLISQPKDRLQKDLLSIIQKVWSDNKLDYLTRTTCRFQMSETEVAEIWYIETTSPDYWIGTSMQGKNLRLRVQILANSLGDFLYPVFDRFGDMIAFGRGYFVMIDEMQVEHFDVYTSNNIYYGTFLDGQWEIEPVTHTLGKLPVIYYSQPTSEWYDVQRMIQRKEVLGSNHADTNDYNGSPIIAAYGKVLGFSAKGESGKVLELEKGSDIKILSWDSLPESLKMERDDLNASIMKMSDTPDISFETMKGLGTFSGIALKMLFLGAHMKASNHEELFGQSIQRRINLIKFALTRMSVSFKPGLNLDIKPEFKYYLPKDNKEEVDILVAAVGAGILSVETAIELNPLIKDAMVEKARVKAETTVKQARQDQVAAQSKPQPPTPAAK